MCVSWLCAADADLDVQSAPAGRHSLTDKKMIDPLSDQSSLCETEANYHGADSKNAFCWGGRGDY